MNEFIVWCKNKNEWEADECVLTRDGKLIDIKYMKELNLENHTIYRYIGKTDIEGNKIYADCSIVEFEYYDMDVDSGWVKAKSVITFDDEDLMYLIAIDGELCNFKQHDIVNLRVIGTLQENPELLGDNK
ncbi:MAG: YopX family protein [Candidatus Cloacimonas sp.]